MSRGCHGNLLFRVLIIFFFCKLNYLVHNCAKYFGLTVFHFFSLLVCSMHMTSSFLDLVPNGSRCGIYAKSFRV